MKTYTISSTNAELTNVNAVCIFSKTSNGKVNHFANIMPNVCYDENQELHKVNTLSEIYKICYLTATSSNKLINLFNQFAKYGVFVPNSAKYHLFGAMRNAVNNSIMLCTGISEKYTNDKGIETYDYTFAPLFTSEVSLNDTALSMKKKTLDAVCKLTKVSEWHNAAKGILCQFSALSIRKDIENGKAIILDKLENENETATVENSAVA